LAVKTKDTGEVNPEIVSGARRSPVIPRSRKVGRPIDVVSESWLSFSCNESQSCCSGDEVRESLQRLRFDSHAPIPSALFRPAIRFLHQVLSLPGLSRALLAVAIVIVIALARSTASWKLDIPFET
jgi:hypothetical protein